MTREEVIKKIEDVFVASKLHDFVNVCTNGCSEDDNAYEIKAAFLYIFRDEIEQIVDLVPTEDIRVTKGDAISTEHIGCFKPGEIVYAIGNDDWYPAIFEMPDSYEDDYMECKYIVQEPSGWVDSKRHCFDLTPDMEFRKATDEEIGLFNKIKNGL